MRLRLLCYPGFTGTVEKLPTKLMLLGGKHTKKKKINTKKMLYLIQKHFIIDTFYKRPSFLIC